VQGECHCFTIPAMIALSSITAPHRYGRYFGIVYAIQRNLFGFVCWNIRVSVMCGCYVIRRQTLRWDVRASPGGLAQNMGPRSSGKPSYTVELWEIKWTVVSASE